MRRGTMAAAVVLLAVFVAALATQAKLSQYQSDDSASRCLKATKMNECRAGNWHLLRPVAVVRLELDTNLPAQLLLPETVVAVRAFFVSGPIASRPPPAVL